MARGYDAIKHDDDEVHDEVHDEIVAPRSMRLRVLAGVGCLVIGSALGLSSRRLEEASLPSRLDREFTTDVKQFSQTENDGLLYVYSFSYSYSYSYSYDTDDYTRRDDAENDNWWDSWGGCFAADARVTVDSLGTTRRMEDVVPGDRLLTVADDGTVEFATASCGVPLVEEQDEIKNQKQKNTILADALAAQSRP